MPDPFLGLGAALAAHAVLARTSIAGRPSGVSAIAAHVAATAMVLVIASAGAWGVAVVVPSDALHRTLLIAFAAILARGADLMARRDAALHRLLAPGVPLLSAVAMVLAAATPREGPPPAHLLAAAADAAGVAAMYGGGLLALSALAERLEESPMPRALHGTPAAVIGAAILGLAIMGLIRAST